jgi:transcriptional regulator with XRE-family HTH domain
MENNTENENETATELESGSDEQIKAIAASLRQIRKQKGYTLKAVEKLSLGKWKAVVVGSYERQDRALSLNRAIGLARFYQVPLDQLLGLTNPVENLGSNSDALVVDLRRALGNPPRENSEEIFQKFLTSICSKRRDWNGEVLSLRARDIETIALLLDQSEQGVRNWLTGKHYRFMVG